MRAPLRSWATLLCFLLLLGAFVASGSGVLDRWVLILVWSAFLIGSVVLIIKSARGPSESRGFYFGQTAWLPRNWQRWILGEGGPSKTEPPGNPDRRAR
jgi:hypothetical protein